MVFQPGNKLWQFRTKRGSDVIFKSPEILLKEAYKYFKWCDDNPWKVNTAAKAGDHFGEQVSADTSRPYTMRGLCVYLQVSESYFRVFKHRIKNGEYKKDHEEEFLEVIQRIEDIIYTQKFEGAAVGAFHPLIIARDLGLREKTDITASGFGIIVKDLTDEDISDDQNDKPDLDDISG